MLQKIKYIKRVNRFIETDVIKELKKNPSTKHIKHKDHFHGVLMGGQI